MAEPEQVFVVTSGCYSDYRIESVWLTLEEAQATAGEHDDVEVWPVGTRKRTLGGFYASGDINPTTGAVGREWTEEYAGYPPRRTAAPESSCGRTGRDGSTSASA